MSLTGIGEIVQTIGNLAGEFIETPKEKREMEFRLAELAQKSELAQIAVNQVEAASADPFTSRWRPFIGWVCGAAFAWNWIGLPICMFLATLFNHPLSLQAASMDEMMPVLLGLLGLGGMRTFEKVRGAEGNR